MSYHFLCKRGIRPARTEQFLVKSVILSRNLSSKDTGKAFDFPPTFTVWATLNCLYYSLLRSCSTFACWQSSPAEPSFLLPSMLSGNLGDIPQALHSGGSCHLTSVSAWKIFYFFKKQKKKPTNPGLKRCDLCWAHTTETWTFNPTNQSSVPVTKC